MKDNIESTIMDQISIFTFDIGVQLYSRVDTLCTFKVDVGNNKVTPDEYVQHEMNFNWYGQTEEAESQRINKNKVQSV